MPSKKPKKPSIGELRRKDEAVTGRNETEGHKSLDTVTPKDADEVAASLKETFNKDNLREYNESAPKTKPKTKRK